MVSIRAQLLCQNSRFRCRDTHVSKSRTPSRERMIWKPRVTQEGTPKRSGDMDGLLLGSINISSRGAVSRINPVSIEVSQSGATGDGDGNTTLGLRLMQENHSASQDSKGQARCECTYSTVLGPELK